MKMTSFDDTNGTMFKQICVNEQNGPLAAELEFQNGARLKWYKDACFCVEKDATLQAEGSAKYFARGFVVPPFNLQKWMELAVRDTLSCLNANGHLTSDMRMDSRDKALLNLYTHFVASSYLSWNKENLQSQAYGLHESPIDFDGVLVDSSLDTTGRASTEIYCGRLSTSYDVILTDSSMEAELLILLYNFMHEHGKHVFIGTALEKNLVSEVQRAVRAVNAGHNFPI